MSTISYNGVEFELTTMSNEGLTFVPEIGDYDEVVSNVVTPRMWDLKQFAEIHRPVTLGIVDSYDVENKSLRVLDMPIKFPGSLEMRVPEQLLGLMQLIRQVAEIERANNPMYEDMFCYITLDQRPTEVNETQRKGGAHVDGFQGARITEKNVNDHSYIVSDRADCTTEFYPQTFDVSGLDERYDNFFHEFDRQVDMTKAVRAEADELMVFDAYAVHAATPAQVAGGRTFVRLSWTVREFDRLGNTHNPMFDYQWEMFARDVASTLTSR